MENKKMPPEREQIDTTGIRIPSLLNEKIREKSTELGISQNAMYMVLLDLGLKTYESQIIRCSTE